MATDDGHASLRGADASDFTEETGSTDDIEGGDTEEVAGVENTSLLKGACDDGDGGVDRVGDDENVGVRGDPADSCGEVTDDGGVGLRSMEANVRTLRKYDKIRSYSR